MLENLEIHMLICKKDLSMGMNCLKSLLEYEEFSHTQIYFHEDGSLCEAEIKILKDTIKNSEVITKKEADELIKPYLSNHPFCQKYRLGTKKDVYLWHKIKTFDYFLLSKTKNILGLDSDLLFVNKPKELIELIKGSFPCYFPDIQSAYSFNEPKDEIPTLPSVNTGIMLIPGEQYYHIDSIEKALSNLIRNEINYFPSWIEQSAFAHMFYVDGRYKVLDRDRNRIPFFQNVNIEIAECLHFVSYPDVRKLYKNYVHRMEFSKSARKAFEKVVEVGYESKKIPLKITALEDEHHYNFEFEWDLETAGIKFLSHQFKIIVEGNERTYEFGSDKSGFFITPKSVGKIQMFHTYDWYGEKNWEEIKL